MSFDADTSLFSYNSRDQYETCYSSSECTGSLFCCYTGKYTTTYSYTNYYYYNGHTYSYAYSYSYYGLQDTCDYRSGCKEHTPSNWFTWVPFFTFFFIFFMLRVCLVKQRRQRLEQQNGYVQVQTTSVQQPMPQG